MYLGCSNFHGAPSTPRDNFQLVSSQVITPGRFIAFPWIFRSLVLEDWVQEEICLSMKISTRTDGLNVTGSLSICVDLGATYKCRTHETSPRI